MCHEYQRINALDRAVFAVSDPRMFSDRHDDWESISQMAKHYSDTIQRHHEHTSGSKEMILGGYSFGGVVAFEIARFLSQRGTNVLGVILIDAPPAFDHIPISRETVELAMQAKHGDDARSRSARVAEFEAAIGRLAIRNNLRRAALLGRYRPSPNGWMPPLVLLRSTEGFNAGGKRLPSNPWLHDRRDPETCVGSWEQLIKRPVPVLDIPGDHFNPFEPGHIDGTSEALRQACEMMDERAGHTSR